MARRLEARTCTRCGHRFVCARRLLTTCCGACQVAESTQRAALDAKYEYRQGHRDLGRVRAPVEDE